MLPSIIQENFLSRDEIAFIEDQVLSLGDHYDDIQNGIQHSYYKTWSYYNKKFAPIKEILEPKFRKLLNFNFVVDHSHILQSIEPYTIHTDWNQNRMIEKLTPAYTLIIPIQDVRSNTVVFNQHSTLKNFRQWVKEEHPPILPKDEQITDEIREKYLTHIEAEWLRYVSLKEIFHWKPGSIHAADRKYFHCSDNYHKNGIKEKHAFVFWLSAQN